LRGISKMILTEAGKTLLITGPASYELIGGKASILGAPLDFSKNTVARGKQAPIEIHASSSFKVNLGNDARVEELDGSTIPLSWHEAASALAEIGEGVVVVVGGADTGKTTLCTYLSNSLILDNGRPAIVDADIGQTDLGPPTTLAAAEVTASVADLSQLKPSERLFIGFTSPSHAKDKVIRSIKRLVELHTRPGRIVIVNTDGWIDGDEAVLYKLQLLDALQPNLTMVIRGKETSSLLQTRHRTLLLGSPDTIRERTRIDRRELRSLGYQKHLAGAAPRNLHLDGTRLRYCLASNDLDLDRISRLQLEAMKGVIVGLLDADDFLQEIGVLKDLVRSTRTMRVWSRPSSTPSKIEIGDVKLSDEGRELGHLWPESHTEASCTY
jgi:polynucleotide 5'-hydroxyl-kinase GRC3/NOL9